MEARRNHVVFGVGALVIAVGGLSAGGFYATRSRPAPQLTTEPITRGDVVETVTATGTLEAVTTVQVGAQVTGRVEQLAADFNSIVRRGQVLARLDPSVFDSQAEQARASLARAEAESARLRVVLEDAEKTLGRSEALAARQLISRSDFEAADVARRSAAVQVTAADAAVLQARAALAQAELNLEKTVITSPIDGIVISRDVDAGQTVSASLQAPTLFVLAADLSKMRVRANVDESDVARVAAGHVVRFEVDAYPATRFAGVVAQVRLQPVTEQNVVTYGVLIDVMNPELKLRPGMTTTVTVEVRRRDNVLRLPNAALRFHPDDATFVALNQPKPSPGGAAARTRGEADNRRADAAGEGAGRVWVMTDGKLSTIPVRTGASDGTYTELAGGTLAEGTEVVTRAQVGAAAAATKTAVSASPLLPTPPRPGPPPGR